MLTITTKKISYFILIILIIIMILLYYSTNIKKIRINPKPQPQSNIKEMRINPGGCDAESSRQSEAFVVRDSAVLLICTLAPVL